MMITDNINKNMWLNFVLNHPKGNIFQTPEIYEVYKNTKNYKTILITTVDDNYEIIGILLSVILKEHSGFIGKFSKRSIIWGGPLVKENNIEILDFILNEYKFKIKNLAIYSQFRNLWEWSEQEKEIFNRNGFEYEDHLDIIIDLKKSENELLMEMHKGRRKNIRRAEQIPLDFIEIQNKNDFEKCLKLIDQTYKRLKLPCPDKSLFLNADARFEDICIIKKFAAKFNDEIISCRFVLCYKDLVYDWFAGTNDIHLEKYPNDFLPWKIIQWANKNNYSNFDFGGAGKPNKEYGVRDHKIKFGGQLVNFGRFEKIHKSLLMRVGRTGIKLLKRF